MPRGKVKPKIVTGLVELDSERLVMKPELLAITGLSYPKIWQMMQTGEFPRARVAGGRTCWLSSQIDQYLRNLPIRKLKGDP
jgi:predicted DNA-binding transcriptional regulator AlpA